MITFQYPGYNPEHSISLGSPERDDDKVLLEEVFIHPTESGQYKSNVKVSCLGEFERTIVITGLCKETVEEFKEFIANSSGHYLRYVDYEGVAWITQITNDVITIAENSGGYEISMTLLVWSAPT